MMEIDPKRRGQFVFKRDFVEALRVLDCRDVRAGSSQQSRKVAGAAAGIQDPPTTNITHEIQ